MTTELTSAKLGSDEENQITAEEAAKVAGEDSHGRLAYKEYSVPTPPPAPTQSHSTAVPGPEGAR